MRLALPRRRGGVPSPPPEVLAAADLGEPVLGSARGDDGTWLLGTRSRLAVVPVDGEPVRLRWEQVEDAGWSGEAEAVRVRELAPYGETRRTWEVPVTEREPRAFLELLRERVTASVVVQRRAGVHRRQGVVVACRRNPTGGPLRFDVVFDAGLDPEDPVVRVAAEDLLARVRAELGELA